MSRFTIDFIHEERGSLEPALRGEIESILVSPESELRTYPSGVGEESGRLWIFAKLTNRNVGFAYSDEGHGNLDLKWGLVFLDRGDYGPSGAWYQSIKDLVCDCGYFDDLQVGSNMT